MRTGRFATRASSPRGGVVFLRTTSHHPGRRDALLAELGRALDIDRPSVARIYDYIHAYANRAFLRRAVTELVPRRAAPW